MSTCFHCGLPVPQGAAFGFANGGAWRAFCCPGCEAVSRAIAGLGLDDYYRLREAPAARPSDDPAPDLAAYDDPEAQSRFVTIEADGTREARLLLEGLRCAACAWLLEQVVRRIPGVEAFDVNYATRRAWLRWDAHAARLSQVLAAVRDVGYAAWPFEESRAGAIEQREKRTLLRRLWIAALGMMQVMMYAVPAYVASDEVTADVESLMRWAGLVLTLPVLLYSAAPFFTGAWRDLRLKRLGMDVPIALGIAAAFGTSVVATLAGRGEVYFDSVTMFVFLITGGRYLELLARARANASLQFLAKLVPQAARSLKPGDEVIVPAGATLPADGRVAGGEALVSEAWLTGESRAARRREGEAVTGGSINAGGPFRLRVERVGPDTALSAIHRMMERALAERPRWVEAAERASGIFVALVLAAALAAGLAWTVLDPSRALWIAISVLIVTCPCAFALATPAAITVATGRLARGGLVITRAHAIEALASVTDVVFDKTGTLTEGRPTLLETKVFTGTLDAGGALALAAALAKLSTHPLDRAIVAAAGGAHRTEVASPRAVAGSGLEATIDGTRTRLGSAAWVREIVPQPQPSGWDAGDDSVVWLGDAHRWIAALRFGDGIRASAAASLARLEAMGLEAHLLSGDDRRVAERVGATLGIDRVRGGATPAAKQQAVRDLQRAGRRVAMVGDGINDAPVLAQADVSIAMGSGADLARMRADAVLLSDDLADLASAVRVARRTRAVVRQNVAWALAYNVVAIPLAFAGLVTPLLAGIGMAASSLLVVANAMRLRR